MSDPQMTAVRELLMPLLTPSEGAGRIERWHVREGQVVAAGDVLAEVATAGLTLEIEAEGEGRIARILVPAGTAGVKVNTPIAILAADAKAKTAPSTSEAVSLLPAAPDAAPAPAEREPSLVGTLTYREALRDALAEEMERDPSIFVVGADVAQNRGAQKVTQGLLDTFGAERVVTMPPLLDGTAGFAFGAALAGLRPVIEVASWGASLEAVAATLEAAAEVAALSGGALAAPLVMRGRNGMAPGLSGLAARCVAGRLAAIPGLIVLEPSSPFTAKALLKAALRAGGPVAVLEPEVLYGETGEVADRDYAAAIGRARIARTGGDVTLVAHGAAVKLALEAALHLALAGLEAEVVDLMSLAPLDLDTVVASATRTRRLLAIEEGPGAGSVGASVLALIAPRVQGILAAPAQLLAAPARTTLYAETLADAGLLQTSAVVGMVKEVCAR